MLRIARENRRMGYGKIAGEMRKLGFVRFGRSSVARILLTLAECVCLPRRGGEGSCRASGPFA